MNILTHTTEVRTASWQRKKINELRRGSEFEDLDKFSEHAHTERAGCENKSTESLQNGKILEDHTHNGNSWLLENQIDKATGQEPMAGPLIQTMSGQGINVSLLNSLEYSCQRRPASNTDTQLSGITTMAHHISDLHEDMSIEFSSLLANASFEACSSYGFLDIGNRSNDQETTGVSERSETDGGGGELE